MADSRLEEIFGRSINTAKELRQGIIDLQNTVKSLGTDEEALSKRVSDLNYAQEEYNKMINSAKQSTDFAKDSIMGMEKEYKNLYNTYKMLNEEQRNSDFGKSMAESLNVLSEKLNNTKKDVGNFKDNIGRYTQSTMDAFNQMGVSVGALQTPMKLAAGGAKTLGASLKALIANPVGVVIMAIVAAFKALEAIVGQVKNAINSNEEAQMRLKEAMAAFQPIIDGVKNAFDKLAQGVVTVIEWVSKAVTAIRTAGAAFTDFIGITKGAKDAIEAQTAAYAGLAKAQNDYIKKQREVKAVNAKDTARVEELREQAMETENATEKLKLLNEAKDIQAQIDERNIALAEENLRILQEESTHTANDAEENEKLAEALAAVEQARAGAARNARTYVKAINSVTSASKKNTEATKEEEKEVERILKEIKEVEEYGKSDEAKLTAKYEKEKALLVKYQKDTTLLTKQYNDNLEKIQKERDNIQKERDRAQLDSLMSGKEALRQALNERLSLQSDLAAINESIEVIKLKFNSLNDIKPKMQEIFDKINQEAKVGTDEYVELLQNAMDEEIKEIGESTRYILTQYLSIDPKTIIDENAWAAVGISIDNESKKLAKAKQEVERNLFDLQSEYDAAYAKMVSPFDKGSFERMDAEAIAEDELLQKKIQIRQLDLENFKGTEEEKLQLRLEVLNLQAEAEEKAYQREMDLLDLTKERNMNLVTDTQSSLRGLSSLIGGLQTLTEAQSKNDKMDEKEKAKKMKRLENLQKLQTAVAIASVVADTSAGMMSIWRAYAEEKVVNARTAAGTGIPPTVLNAKSLVSAILQSAGLAATGAGQLAAIAGNHISGMASISQSSESGGGGASATATPTAIIDSTPYSYTRTLQTAEESEELNKPIYVTVTDIENGLERNRVRIAETTF